MVEVVSGGCKRVNIAQLAGGLPSAAARVAEVGNEVTSTRAFASTRAFRLAH